MSKYPEQPPPYGFQQPEPQPMPGKYYQNDVIMNYVIIGKFFINLLTNEIVDSIN